MRGDWQRFLEPEGSAPLEGNHPPPQTQGAPPRRSFYYNTATAEGTYEEPAEWKLAVRASAFSFSFYTFLSYLLVVLWFSIVKT